jgi:hypothetical protein
LRIGSERKPWDSNPRAARAAPCFQDRSLIRPDGFRGTGDRGREGEVRCGAFRGRTPSNSSLVRGREERASERPLSWPSISSGGTNRTCGLLGQNQASLPTATAPDHRSSLGTLRGARRFGDDRGVLRRGSSAESAQRESNPLFRHGKAVGSRYIMGTDRRRRIVKERLSAISDRPDSSKGPKKRPGRRETPGRRGRRRRRPGLTSGEGRRTNDTPRGRRIGSSLRGLDNGVNTRRTSRPRSSLKFGQDRQGPPRAVASSCMTP